MFLDPTIALTLRAAIALLFAAAVTHKLWDAAHFRSTLAHYMQGFGTDAHGVETPLFMIIVALEFVVAGACMLPSTQAVAGLLAGGTLLLYALAMAVNLLRGNALLDCGCTWGSERQRARPALIVRNGLLSMMAFALAVPVGNRELAAVDIVSVIVATLTTILLYRAGNRLLTVDTAQAE